MTDFDGSVPSFCVVLDVKASISVKKIGIQNVFQKAAPIFARNLIGDNMSLSKWIGPILMALFQVFVLS